MTTEQKFAQGTHAWFKMVAELMHDAALASGMPLHNNMSMIERYSDGVELSEGLIQGLRFDIIDGTLSYRVGVRPDEHADITIEVTAAAAKQLNSFYSTDPAYGAALRTTLDEGKMHLDGDLSVLGDWLTSVHDTIVTRTL